MGLSNLMQIYDSKAWQSSGTTLNVERIKRVLPILRQYVAYWREYPDMFVEFMCGSNPEHFSLFFYQKLFLRAVIRHRYAYATFPRA